MKHFQLGMFPHNFMIGFFLVFSFFKLLDVKAFAESFQMYDSLAAKFPAYGKFIPSLNWRIGIVFNPFSGEMRLYARHHHYGF